jgi:hypothetical protein
MDLMPRTYLVDPRLEENLGQSERDVLSPLYQATLLVRAVTGDPFAFPDPNFPLVVSDPRWCVVQKDVRNFTQVGNILADSLVRHPSLAANDVDIISVVGDQGSAFAERVLEAYASTMADIATALSLRSRHASDGTMLLYQIAEMMAKSKARVDQFNEVNILNDLTPSIMLTSEGDMSFYIAESVSALAVAAIGSLTIAEGAKVHNLPITSRVGVLPLTPENPLFIYFNADGSIATITGQALNAVNTVEANTTEDKIGIAKPKIIALKVPELDKVINENPQLDDTTVIELDPKDLEIKLQEVTQAGEVVVPARPMVVSYVIIEVPCEPNLNLGQIMRELRSTIEVDCGLEFIKSNKTPSKNGKYKISCIVTSRESLGVSKCVSGLQALGAWVQNNGYQGVASMSYGQSCLTENDILSRDVNRAARVAVNGAPEFIDELRQTFTILMDETAYAATLQEAMIVRRKRSLEMLLKGIEKPVTVYPFNFKESFLEPLPRIKKIEEYEYNTLEELTPFIVKELKGSLRLNNYPDIDVRRIINEVLLYSGIKKLRQNQATYKHLNTPEFKAAKAKDLTFLARLVIGSSRINESTGRRLSTDEIIDVLAERSVGLEYPNLLLALATPEELSTLEKLSVVSFGRWVEFKYSTAEEAFGIDLNVLHKLRNKGLLNLLKAYDSPGKWQLPPVVGHILDSRLSVKAKEGLHTQIVKVLMKRCVNIGNPNRAWYGEARVAVLHSLSVDPEIIKQLTVTATYGLFNQTENIIQEKYDHDVQQELLALKDAYGITDAGELISVYSVKNNLLKATKGQTITTSLLKIIDMALQYAMDNNIHTDIATFGMCFKDLFKDVGPKQILFAVGRAMFAMDSFQEALLIFKELQAIKKDVKINPEDTTSTQEKIKAEIRYIENAARLFYSLTTLKRNHISESEKKEIYKKLRKDLSNPLLEQHQKIILAYLEEDGLSENEEELQDRIIYGY